ncbi:hypothetical protein CAPTEDRAFT_178027 [Capitella teleta]|uniref:Tr-type G domain-containing protein n=1 Tax=Capitella teleta TaxID=283909 RepID=R7TEZ5_CAPTE|nr:hypothetical protein CAPTEDRAFT_178027 [Capitella teleta]|eukprot:ELT90052.1 hypothetical protein CAPTEDRAFT_178027 [Capitella teleta]
MSRHRAVRTMNYDDEYDFDDVYGHSVEDDYCVSPGTDQIPEEDETMGDKPEGKGSYDEDYDPLKDSSNFQRPPLNPIDEARLNSCLEEMRNIVGETTPEHLMIDAVLRSDFNYEKALNDVLNSQSGKTTEPKSDIACRPKIFMIGGDEPNEGSVVTAPQEPQVTRMTFSTGNQTNSGFTPEKNSGMDVETESSNPACRDLGDSFASLDVKKSASQAKLDAGDSGSSNNTPKKAPFLLKTKLERLDVKKEYAKRQADGKDFINLVVIGHVDAGKSTLMGHVLYQLGFVNKRTMHKYEQESKKLGKASFAYAWVLDETEEERSRGVTMDVAQTRFQTNTKVVTLLDAPGHKDFIPNMITGAAQADCAILVVNATRGEFETGFDAGGQTREHAMLIRSLGVSQLMVAVNKMDTVDWSQLRYKEITTKLAAFLKQTGFKESDVSYVPCSGLSGENLCHAPKDTQLSKWYTGPTLAEGIDRFRSPDRMIDRAFRMCVGDIFKGMGSGFSVAGTIQAGSVQVGDRLVIMPQGDICNVKGIAIDEAPLSIAFAGDNAVLTITGSDMNNIGVGSILCDPMLPIKVTSRFRARVVIFNIDVPITKGFPVVLHYQSLNEPAHIHRLISQLNKSNGEILKKKPRCLTKNMNAVIELSLSRTVCLELHKDCKELGRIMLRYAGHTIAAGLVTEILDKPSSKTE